MSKAMTALSQMVRVIGAKRAETVKAWRRAARLAERIALAVEKDEMEQAKEMVDEYRIAHLALGPHTARLVELLANESRLHNALIDVALMRLPEEDRGEGEA